MKKYNEKNKNSQSCPRTNKEKSKRPKKTNRSIYWQKW